MSHSTTQTPIQQALGAQWETLPSALKRHYAKHPEGYTHLEQGHLDINYPSWMQAYLSFMRLMGALINQRGTAVPTHVERLLVEGKEQWQRSLQFPNGRSVQFKSQVVYHNANEIIEYTNAIMGLKMAVHVENGKLYYSGKSFILKLGSLRLPIPEWLILGHSTIEENAIDDQSFEMDFRIKHPWFGEVFTYKGTFKVLEAQRLTS
ncbi:DUF4166 domain-containing protein [Thiolinea disciformis]|uniref:DUF4166 domain-containing protein n=1 Tax=Thiolinea disciformis TaxID=125614 RepID=UPI00035ED774|nr:DUF4166 domain-containing protein [Thiolinea disciformis]